MIPKATKKSLEFINKTVDKKGLNRLLSEIYSEYGAAKTAFLANALKDLGFKYATKAGVTISIEDLDVPKIKKELLAEAENQIDRAMYRYYKGDITEVERYTKVIDTWSETTAKLTSAVVDNFHRLNPIYMMAFSGARGNLSQVSQLVGMRGLMADAQGQIIDLPIKANFREGLSVTEYIISSYGARKGLVDTALKTADSGYLTRRLVDVAQDVIISSNDCGTDKYIILSNIFEGDKLIVPLPERLVGRTAFEDVFAKDGTLIIKANHLFDRSSVSIVETHNINEIKVRSPLTCALDYGICQKCYGWALTNNKLVDIGEAIGIIAAQSIGEPGTQLTMRTFHTGGVFKGSSNQQQLKSEVAGTVKEIVRTREFRNRHGDIVKTAIRDGQIVVKTGDGEKHNYHVPYQSSIIVDVGDTVEVGTIIALFEPGVGRADLTEKAQKDITSDLSGQINFEGFVADEKRDRQGNISRTANRGGIIWVLAGDVYNLPTGASLLVKNDQDVRCGDIIAETVTVSEHGGEVRINPEMETEITNVDGEEQNIIKTGKELTVVIASILPKNAKLETTKKEQMWIVEDSEETYIIKSPAGTVVENGMIIAELVDDTYSVPTSGEIRYEDIEVDERRIVTKSGKVLFIPDEVHQISKDVALQLVESGSFVEAGTEVVKDVKAHIDGIVEIIEDNDIIHEVIIRPGELYKIEDIAQIEVEDGDIVDAGTIIAPGIVTSDKRLVNITVRTDSETDDIDFDDDNDTDNDDVSEKYAEVLLRPVQEYYIEPQQISIEFDTTETEQELISIVPVTQLQYRDGDRVRNLEGSVLTRTSLVLQMQGYLTHLKGMVEFNPKEIVDEEDAQNLKIVVLENLIVRREIVDPTRSITTATQTQLLVEDGQYIEPKTPVAKTQVLAEHNGIVNYNIHEDPKELRRILIFSPEQQTIVSLNGQKAIVKTGDFIRVDQEITEENKKSELSGKVIDVNKETIIVRKGRPYLISPGTQLQVNTGNLVQRGDLLATLIFERLKTGDIVQGLPRVEELLEARKPKESAILAEEDGISELEYDEDLIRLFLVNESGRQEIKVPLGANIIVTDKQKIKKGQPLTDGPLNPHDVLRLRDVEAVQQYLVDEVQRVYRSQGVDIADKHIEVIVRRMTKKVRIDDSGTTKLLPGELVEMHLAEEENKMIEGAGGTLAEFHPVLLGITKASLKTDSFISAASFQETTRILTEAAVEGKKDMLRGLKENVIIGRLIPAGTGFYYLNNTDNKFPEIMDNQPLKTASRKPSAILEEIEGMFGSPDFTLD